MPITFDYSNLMADNIGAERGIRADALAALHQPTRELHARIKQRREQGELPFFDLPGDSGTLDSILELSEQLRHRFDTLVVLGIGGSALGTSALFRALRPLGHNLLDPGARCGLPRLFVLDNVDPDGFSAHLDLCDPARTCFLVISKSGSTVETNAQFMVARHWLEQAVGAGFREHFVLITDPENGGLRAMADGYGYRSCAIPSKVGGRFTALTPVSLLPLACVGVDIRALLQGAADFAPRVCHAELETNPAYLNAALNYLAYGQGLRTCVMMPYSDRLRDLADWFRQLWAESLGKKYDLQGNLRHIGPTPVNALGTTDQHSQVQLYLEGPADKLVTFITVEQFDRDLTIPAHPDSSGLDYLAGHSMGELIRMEQLATAAALSKNQRPHCTLSIPRVSAETLGALIYLFEVQTLFAGALFDINPLDQPAVEEGKNFTYALMGRAGYEEQGREFASIQARLKPWVLRCD